MFLPKSSLPSNSIALSASSAEPNSKYPHPYIVEKRVSFIREGKESLP